MQKVTQPNYIPYEITITINPRKQFQKIPYGKLRPTEQWEELQDICYKIIQKYPYKIRPEQHKNGNLHCHGICWIHKDESKFIILDKQKYFNQYGRTNFKPINDYFTWKIYIKKNADENLNLKHQHKKIEYEFHDEIYSNYINNIYLNKLRADAAI